MKKTLYSLMLSDDVIREIDLLAHRMGTNRSNLVNRILAEHVQVRTPEQRINDIFNAIEKFMSSSPDLVVLTVPDAPSMELRSCLEYKYRPTVRYEVEILKNPITGRMNRIGYLSVIFRSQSTTLIGILENFFRNWMKVENSLLPINIEYSYEEGKFTRSLAYPTVKEAYSSELNISELSANEYARMISDYIRLFDRLLKGYVSGRLTSNEIHSEYQNYYENLEIII
jgi:hypothetical protein